MTSLLGFFAEIFSYENVEFVIYMYLIPLVCIPGIIAATMSSIVFARMRQTSLEVLLCGLSLFDVILLTSSILIYPSMCACSKEENRADSFVCHFFWRCTIIIWPLSLMAQVGSVWTCVAVTFDRFIAVSFPIKKRVWCTPSTSAAVLCVITVFSALFKLPSFFEVRLDEKGEVQMTWLRENVFYITFYVFYLYVAVIQLVPWTAIIALNAVVIHKVRLAYRLQAVLIQNSEKPRSKREDAERRVTVMATVMTGIFIICNIPPGVNNLVDHLDVSYKYVFRQRIPLSNLLVCVNSASNMLIYCVFNAKFRQGALRLIGVRRKGSRGSVSRLHETSYMMRSRVATSENLQKNADSPTPC
ncbi:unnamed protein product [Caenorhabditis auriculariae]|uniref:G-protein coupled receptors family 1 profile domain-containing protein n=1 Tax=Caenorhabditis auriculariae TaxID=2777116 RepID=A0A8S1HP07_9PELO|nr:unnamed protein product [Caenorhabditis auriculariae]